jgi:hypothetical protein
VERDRLDASVRADTVRFVGKQLRERGERTLGQTDCPHLEPVAKQHDHDQQRQLPPEVEIEVTDPEARCEAGNERHTDSQPNQQHHPGLPRAHLVVRARQERAAADDENDDAEDRRDPRRATGPAVAQQVGEHLAERDDRDGQQQVPPEQTTELRHVIAVAPAFPVALTALVGRMSVAAGDVLWCVSGGDRTVVVIGGVVHRAFLRRVVFFGLDDRNVERSAPASSLSRSSSCRQCSSSGSGKVSASR